MNQEDNIRAWQKSQGVELFHKLGLKPDSSLLDFGCGAGNYLIPARLYLSKSLRVYGLDINPAIILRAKKNASLMQTATIRFISNLDSIPKNSLDIVLIYDLIHMLQNRKSKLKQIGRCLKPGGILSIAPFHMNEADISHMIQELEDLGYKLDNILRDEAIHFAMQDYAGDPNAPIDEYPHGDIYNFRKI